MNFWWCNQTAFWNREFKAGVISSSTNTARPAFRATVGEARKGDIILHYRSNKGIVAVSRALMDAASSDENKKVCIHGTGYGLTAEYRVFKKPIPRELVMKRILALKLLDSPVKKFKTGRIQIFQAYFIPFSLEGFRIVYRVARDRDWPNWAVAAASSSDQRRLDKQLSTRRLNDNFGLDNNLFSALEGTLMETRHYIRKRDLRLRRLALKNAKGICAGCRRNFSRFLGGLGLRVLQVHHIKQLSDSNVPRLNNVLDLAVVCANCHSVIHADRKRALTVSELRRLMSSAGTG